MGWFAIACICGLLGYRCWRLASNWLVQRQQVASAEILYAVVAFVMLFGALVLSKVGSLSDLTLGIAAGFLSYRLLRSLWGWLPVKGRSLSAGAKEVSAAIGIVIVIVGFRLWVSLSQNASAPNMVVEIVQRDSVVRFLFALIIGIGAGILRDWGRSPEQSPPVRTYKISNDSAGTISAVGGFAIVLAGLVLWAILSQDARTLGGVADALRHGSVARFLLGLILGTGAAFVVAERPAGQSAASAAKPAPLPDNGILPGDVSKRDLPMPWIAAMGLTIVILALVAPHLDDWLRRLTGFKSPYVELQLASSSTHKISVEEGAEVLLSIDSLSYLVVYDTKIQQDIDYLTKYGSEVPRRDEIVSDANKLLPAFKAVFGPITKCVQSAIDHGWLTFDSARQMLRPTADAVEKIIFAEKTLNDSGELDAKYDQFWQHVLELPDIVTSSVKEPECTKVQKMQYSAGSSDGSPGLFPKIRDFQSMPYLHVAAALLAGFMGDNDKALSILQKAEPKLAFKDYYFLLLKARLSYYNGKPGDIWQTYLSPLDEMRSIARNHIDVMEKKDQECVTPDNTILICRDLVAELQAKNYAAYFIAEDLARGSDYVGPYVVRLQEYGEDMKRVVNETVSNSTRHRGFYQILGKGLYDRYLPIRYAVLDTYAYATLVLEARKPSPDYDVIKNKVIPMLKETSDAIKSLYEKEAMVERIRLSQVRIGEAHLASAREFVGE